MKSLKIALLASLVLAPCLATRAASPAQNWLETYYMNPRPDALPRMVQDLSYQGYFDQAGHSAIAIGFLSTVFRQNPERVSGWVADLGHLPLAHLRLVAAALWQAGNPLGAKMIHELSAGSPVAADMERLAATASAPVAATPVVSPSSMNLQWGAFLASGSERNIVAILNAIGTGQPGLDDAARYALAQNAAAHPRVMEICRAQLGSESGTTQAVVRAALQDASARSGTGS